MAAWIMERPKDCGSWLPKEYVEKIVWALNDTSIAVVLAVRNLCGGSLCGRNGSLGKRETRRQFSLWLIYGIGL